MAVPELSRGDLDHVLERTRDVWPDFSGASVFITGATGFVGSWMLETLLHANRALNLRVRTTALVRDRDAFVARLPHLADVQTLQLQVGDVRTVDLVRSGSDRFTHFVHCASAATPQLSAEQPDAVVDLITGGTQHLIAQAEQHKAARFLQMSSGSVYGPQPATVERIPESYTGEADASEPTQRFGAAKAAAERLGAAALERGVHVVSARGFALVGPRLPLDGQFALGQFLANALAGRSVHVTSDGSPVRSWMHVADLAAWSWTLLARGRPGQAYNVGSEEAVTLGEAAECVARLPVIPVTVTRGSRPCPGTAPSRYVPSTQRARDEFGLEAWTRFDGALARTWKWLNS